MNEYDKDQLAKIKENLIFMVEFETEFLHLDLENLKDKIVENVLTKEEGFLGQDKENRLEETGRRLEEMLDEFIKIPEKRMNEIKENIELECSLKEEGKEKRKRGRPRKFGAAETAYLLIIYEKLGSIKAVVENHRKKGRSISDKEVRLILEREGKYKRKTRGKAHG